VRLPALNVDRGVFALPDALSFDEGTFAEPLACALRAQRLAGVRPGRSVLVLGAGIAGLLHVKLAAALGAGRILATDVLEARRAAAQRFGAEAVFDGRGDVPRLVREVNEGRGADVVLVCASVAASTSRRSAPSSAAARSWSSPCPTRASTCPCRSTSCGRTASR